MKPGLGRCKRPLRNNNQASNSSSLMPMSKSVDVTSYHQDPKDTTPSKHTSATSSQQPRVVQMQWRRLSWASCSLCIACHPPTRALLVSHWRSQAMEQRPLSHKSYSIQCRQRFFRQRRAERRCRQRVFRQRRAERRCRQLAFRQRRAERPTNITIFTNHPPSTRASSSCVAAAHRGSSGEVVVFVEYRLTKRQACSSSGEGMGAAQVFVEYRLTKRQACS